MSSFKSKTKKIIKAYVYHAFSWKKAFLLALLGFLSGLVIPLVGILTATVLYYPHLPDPELLDDYKPPLVSEVYAANGVKIGQFAGQRRIWVSVDDVSPTLINALLAAEDKEFYNHWGVSITGIIRAAYKNIEAGRVVQGASTITQQLAKNLFLTPEVAYSRKVKEALTSVMIERRYSKSEILELYINQNFMGKGCYGMQAASLYYFNRNADSLKIEQAAYLAGLLQSPSAYSNNHERAKRRRDQIIRMMGNENIIPPEIVDSLVDLPLGLEVEELEAYQAPYFVEHIRRYIQRKYGSEVLYESGLKIYTTLDLEIQGHAEEALEWKLDQLQRWNQRIRHDDDSLYTYLVFDPEIGDTVRKWKQVQGAVLVMEPSTGYIKAMIGGRDFRQSEFNRATQALRQPGSAFKPFVYTVAIDNGWQPTDIINDTPQTFPMEGGRLWRPRNYDGTYLGDITLREAIAKSRNLASIHLTEKIGPRRVASLSKNMGIRTPVEPYLSVAMGANVVRITEITAAYCAFANGGLLVEPIAITRIEDNEGRIIEQNLPQPTEVLSPGVAYVMTNMLESVINNGTAYGARLSGFDRPAAGKTGTTNDCSDAWFIGYTPQLCATVWIGFDDILSLGENQTGSRAALPVWTRIMLNSHKNYVRRDFVAPIDEVVVKDVCRDSYDLATSRCPRITREVFLAKNPVPEKYCPLSHRTSERPFEHRSSSSDDDTERRTLDRDTRRDERRTGF